MAYVSIGSMSLAIAYIEDVINHCQTNQLTTLGKSLSVIKGLLINRNHYRALIKLDSLEPVNAFEHAVKLQLTAFFKKNESLPKAADIDEVTMAAFHSAEFDCMCQNYLELFYRNAPALDPMNFVFMKVKNRIKQVLGPFSQFEKRLPELVRLSQGATSFHKRPYSTADRKLFHCDEMSEECATIARYVYQDSPYVLGFLGHGSQDYNCSRVVTVPKSYKTNRTIAAEPAGHTVWQLAFDSFVKDRLLDFGVDLRDQTPNQQLAFEGSCSQRYATVDLKQASDTIAYEVVHMLFPEDWFNYLDFIRVPCGKLPDKRVVEFEKFSSMGNGTTFCIETIIFEACVFVASRGSIDRCVYGDDIVIRQEFVHDLENILSRFGFKINETKTHVSGKYRESCGEHYFDGCRVTPINLLRERMTIDIFYDFANRFIESLFSEAYSCGVTFDRTIAVIAKAARIYDAGSKADKHAPILFVPTFFPSTSGLRAPAVDGNVRLWRVSLRDDMHFVKGVIVKSQTWNVPVVRAYLLWLQVYASRQGCKQAPAVKGRKSLLHAIDIDLCPTERVTTTAPHPDKVRAVASMIPCLWQVSDNPRHAYVYSIVWEQFREPKNAKSKNSRK